MRRLTPTVSVVVPARDAANWLPVCLDALTAQQPPPAEIVVVDDGSADETAAIARAHGVRVVELGVSRGPGGARNAGASAATGDVIAFVDADDTVEPGWCEAIGSAFSAGATAAATRLSHVATGGIPQRFVAIRAARTVRSPSSTLATSGGQLAVRREVFADLGGFDETLMCGEDIDLSLRLSLAGHRLVEVPGAVVTRRERATVWGLLRQRARWAYWWPFLTWKWQHHHFVLARARIRSSATFALAQAGANAATGRFSSAFVNLLEAVTQVATVTGRTLGQIDLVRGRRPVPEPMPHATSPLDLLPPLPDGPDLLLVGDPRRVRFVARALRAGSELASPPPGLVGARAWDSPPGWSRRLVREAARAGWRLVPDAAARRLELEEPATYGEAVVVLHRVFAWLHGKPGFVMAAGGRAGDELIRHMPGVCVVDADALGWSPTDAADGLERLGVGEADRLLAGLRLARLTPWRR